MMVELSPLVRLCSVLAARSEDRHFFGPATRLIRLVENLLRCAARLWYYKEL